MFSAKPKPTDAGRILLAKCQTGAEMRFTRVKIGSGYLGETDPNTLLDVVQEEKSFEITSIRRAEETTYVKFVLANDELVPYYFRELALMADDPDAGEIAYLYANDGDNAELIGTNKLEREITLAIPISKAENITITIPSSATVDREEFDAHVKDKKIHITEEERKAWNDKVGTDESGKINKKYLPDLNVEGLGGYKKENILSAETKDLFELEEDAVPDAVFSKLKKTADSHSKEIKETKDSVAAAAKMVFGSYTGSDKFGSANKNRIDLNFKPHMIMIGGEDIGIKMCAMRGLNEGQILTETTVQIASGTLIGVQGKVAIEWGETYVQWYSETSRYDQLNNGGTVYSYVVVGN